MSSQEEMEALRQRVMVLESKVAALEAAADASRPKEEPTTPDVLAQLLGSPPKWDIADFLMSEDRVETPVSSEPSQVRGSGTNAQNQSPETAILEAPEPSEVEGSVISISRYPPSPLAASGTDVGPSSVKDVPETGETDNYRAEGRMDPPGSPLARATAAALLPMGTRGAAVLVIGDSMVRRAGFVARPPYHLTVAGRGGLTWRQGQSWVRRRIAEWRAASRAEGRYPDTLIIWAGGNDAYGGGRDRPADVGAMAKLATDLAEIVPAIILVGPTPRPATDNNRPWNETPAFSFEQQMLALRDEQRGIRVVGVGRQVCQFRNKPRGYYVYGNRHFARDGVHLNGSGYVRVLARPPEWLSSRE